MSFGQASTASQSAPKESPFSKLANAGPLGGTASQPQQQPSLLSGFGSQLKTGTSQGGFGNLGSSLGQSSTTIGGTGTGLLGLSQLGSSRPQQNQNTPASSQLFGSSFLAPQLPQQPAEQQTNPSQEISGQNPIEPATPVRPAYFQTLLEKSKKRAHATNGGPAFGDLPNLQLGLEDIARRARELGSFESQDKRRSTDGKASDPQYSLGLQEDRD